MSDYGIKISQSGNNVGTATNQQLVLTSARNTALITVSGTVSLTTSTSTDTNLTVPHNLGYIPVVMAFADDGTYNYALPNTNAVYFGLIANIGVGVDASNIYVGTGVDVSGTPHTITIRYLLHVQPLA